MLPLQQLLSVEMVTVLLRTACRRRRTCQLRQGFPPVLVAAVRLGVASRLFHGIAMQNDLLQDCRVHSTGICIRVHC